MQPKSISPDLENAALFYGMYSRVARQLGVSPQHVRQVARGLHASKRVSSAVQREIKRLQSKASKTERAA